jgi:sugar phosphate isomerase/epimerase
MTRRTALAAIGAASFALRAPGQTPPAPDTAPQPKFGYSAPRRTAPMLCMFSRNMERIPYYEIGGLAQQIGFQGIDLTVTIGGHVDPRVTNVDLIRAFESIRAANLEVPMITTSINSPLDPTIYPVLYLTGHSQIPLFRLGLWPYDDSVDIRQRILQVRRDLLQVAALGQRCEICALFPNHAGAYVGEATWDAESIVADMDPRWVGHMFDPAEATIEGGAGGWEHALRLALPRLKAVSLQDFYWTKDGGTWTPRKCPLGDGMVDWTKFFGILATAKFTGPISIAQDYAPKNPPGAMAKDLEFASQQVRQAWPT